MELAEHPTTNAPSGFLRSYGTVVWRKSPCSLTIAPFPACSPVGWVFIIIIIT